MKLFSYAIIIATLFAGCSNANKQNTSGSSGKGEQSVDQQEIILKVKNKSITEEFTAGQVIDSLAGADGMASWQLFKPGEYKNDPNIIGVAGSAESKTFGGSLSFKIFYLYQFSTQKVIFYAGYLNGNPIEEYEFVINYKKKQLYGI
jgi:hypothetical protein